MKLLYSHDTKSGLWGVGFKAEFPCKIGNPEDFSSDQEPLSLQLLINPVAMPVTH